MIHEFEEDFYGAEMRLLICAFIRPQVAFSSMGKCELSGWVGGVRGASVADCLCVEELIAAIKDDVEKGKAFCASARGQELRGDELFVGCGGEASASES